MGLRQQQRGTYMVLILQFGRLDLLELLRQGRHGGRINRQEVEKSLQKIATGMGREVKEEVR